MSLDRFITWLLSRGDSHWKKQYEIARASLRLCVAGCETQESELVAARENILKLEKELAPFKIPVPKVSGELDGISLIELLNEQVGVDCEKRISDMNYKLIARSEMERFLKQDLTNTHKYIAEDYDCDDFSFRLMGMLSAPGWAKIAAGILWGRFPKPHAINCFVDSNHAFWLIEPQSDRIFRMPSNWEPIWLAL